MTIDEDRRYAPKVDRLLHIRKVESLSHLVLPVFPIKPLSTIVAGSLPPAADAVSIYAATLEKASPQLRQRVEAVCGPAPWIVRSAGNEDLTDNVNAGGYERHRCLRRCRPGPLAVSGFSRSGLHGVGM